MQEITQFIQHHWILNLALLIVLIVLMIFEFINQKTSAQKLSPAQAIQLINRANATVLDVRTAALYAPGHIIGSVSIPLTELEDKIKKLEKFKSNPIVIVCAIGVESPRAAALLTSKGFDARILAGGIRAWREAEMPVVKE